MAGFIATVSFLMRVVWNAIISRKSVFLDDDLNYGPVKKENSSRGLSVVQGSIPAGLNGAYVRNGPNPYIKPRGRYHWFDGDGMLHEVQLKDGKATYSNKWVKTDKFQIQKKKGFNIKVSVKCASEATGALLFPMWAVFCEKIGMKTGKNGTGNTGLEFHDGRLLALQEVSRPHHIKLPSLDTEGIHDFDGKLGETDSFTAHPKVDPVSGEMRFFGYKFLGSPPFLKHHRVTKEGELAQTVPITLKKACMVHDFAITENFSVFLHLPLTFDMNRAKKGKPLLMFETQGQARIGILPRDATSEESMEWFDINPCYSYHTFNAWEEDNGNKVILVACRSEVAGLFDTDRPVSEDSTDSYVYQWTIDRTAKTVEERRLNDVMMEFPVINQAYLGRKTKYGYAALFDWTGRASKKQSEPAPLILGCCKVDLETGEVIKQMHYGKGIYGGEPFFVPKPNSVEEDDGYLMTFTHDLTRNVSHWRLTDAKTFDTEPVCLIEMPERVPFGFHGKWVSQEQIDSQRE